MLLIYLLMVVKLTLMGGFMKETNDIASWLLCRHLKKNIACKQCQGETTRPCKENGKCDVSTIRSFVCIAE
jgi:hypothetical protein